MLLLLFGFELAFSDPILRHKVQPFCENLAGSLGGKSRDSAASLGGASLSIIFDLPFQRGHLWYVS
jgi:hypothetical protein